MGVDGITFLNGTLYVINVIFNKLYRIPVDAAASRERPSISGWTSRSRDQTVCARRMVSFSLPKMAAVKSLP